MKFIFLSICLAALALPGLSQNVVKVTECVIEKGELKNVEVDYNTATGNRTITVNGVMKKFYDLYPQDGPEYAAKAGWYINSEPITLNAGKFVKYGLPRVLTPFEISKTGTYKGIGVYIEAGLTEQEKKDVEVIYIPVRSGCEFQPYEKHKPSCATATLKADKTEFTAGENVVFTTTVSDILGTASYEWHISSGTIVGKHDGNNLTVSTAGLKSNFLAEVTVRASGQRCMPVVLDLMVKIKN